jgi:hypothetical protein
MQSQTMPCAAQGTCSCYTGVGNRWWDRSPSFACILACCHKRLLYASVVAASAGRAASHCNMGCDTDQVWCMSWLLMWMRSPGHGGQLLRLPSYCAVTWTPCAPRQCCLGCSHASKLTMGVARVLPGCCSSAQSPRLLPGSCSAQGPRSTELASVWQPSHTGATIHDHSGSSRRVGHSSPLRACLCACTAQEIMCWPGFAGTYASTEAMIFCRAALYDTWQGKPVD